MHLHEGMHHGIKTHVKASKVGTLKTRLGHWRSMQIKVTGYQDLKSRKALCLPDLAMHNT